MEFTMTVACNDCPFRKAGGIRLTKGRIRELSRMMLDSQGGTFSCHKSVDYSGEDADDTGMRRDESEVHCAGALAYAVKQGTLPQLARIMERLRAFDGDKIVAKCGDEIWDSEREWLAGGVDVRPKAKASPAS
jgi:hypothetical protein